MAGIPWGLWSAYFVSTLWCGLWISESSMHLPPHVRLGHRGWRERLVRESLCFNWLLSSSPHAPQSLLAQGNVGSQVETLSYQLRKALCVLVKNEMKKEQSGQGGEEPGPLVCSLLCQLSQSHIPLGRRDLHLQVHSEHALCFELHQTVESWVIPGPGCNSRVASIVSVQISVRYKYLSA